MKSSSTAQNVVLGFGGRPAPDTPDAASTMMPVGLDQPGPHQRGEGQARRPSGSSRGRPRGWRPGSRRGTARAGRRRSRRAARARRAPRRTRSGRAQASWQPEVGGQVDDVADPADQLGHDRLRGPVGQTEEHEVEAVDRRRVVGREDAGPGRRPPGSGRARRPPCRPGCRRWPRRRRGRGAHAASRSSSAPVNPDAPTMPIRAIREIMQHPA